MRRTKATGDSHRNLPSVALQSLSDFSVVSKYHTLAHRSAVPCVEEDGLQRDAQRQGGHGIARLSDERSPHTPQADEGGLHRGSTRNSHAALASVRKLIFHDVLLEANSILCPLRVVEASTADALGRAVGHVEGVMRVVVGEQSLPPETEESGYAPHPRIQD